MLTVAMPAGLSHVNVSTGLKRLGKGRPCDTIRKVLPKSNGESFSQVDKLVTHATSDKIVERSYGRVRRKCPRQRSRDCDG